MSPKLINQLSERKEEVVIINTPKEEAVLNCPKVEEICKENPSQNINLLKKRDISGLKS
jgi:hypothetical protein